MIIDANIEYLRNKLVDFYNPEKILLFGSYAYGSPNKDSDIDLFVIYNSDLPKNKRLIVFRTKLEKYNKPFDLLVYTPQEVEYWNGVTNHIITEVMKKGIVLYEKGN